jgi:hypothetical protein
MILQIMNDILTQKRAESGIQDPEKIHAGGGKKAPDPKHLP